LAEILEKVAAVRVRLRVLGRERDRAAIERLGLLQAVLPSEEVAQIVARLGVVRVERDRRLVANSRFVATPQTLEYLPEIVAASRRVGPQRRSLLDEGQSGGQVPGLERDDAEHMQRICMLRLPLQNLAVAALGCVETPRLMVLQCSREGMIRADLWHGYIRLSGRLSGRRSGVKPSIL